MQKVPVRVDGRFRLKEVLGSGSHGMFVILVITCRFKFNTWNLLAVVYRTQNILNDVVAAAKLEPITDPSPSSSVEHEYCVLKQLEGGVGIPRALWFGRESAYHVLVIDLLTIETEFSLGFDGSHSFSTARIYF